MSAHSEYVTLVANQAATVTLDTDYDEVEVVNVDNAGAAPIYFQPDEHAAAATVQGAGTEVVPAVAGARVRVACHGEPTTVTLISTGASTVGVFGRSYTDRGA